MENDGELLRRYVEGGSDAAFRQLVQRHLDFVYGAALRMTRRPHRAEDVAQAVFTDLCRKARTLCSRTDLVGWLYLSTHYAAKQLIRREARREARESAVAALDEAATFSAEWNALAPFADEALRSLRDLDREAILLRFFKNASFAEVGAALGLSENAARMRVERALEKLRHSLRRHGVISTAAALELALAAHPAVAAPGGLATSISSGVLSGLGAPTSLAAAVFALMNTSKVILGAAAIAILAGATFYERTERTATEARLAAVTADRDALRGVLATMKAALRNEPPSPSRPSAAKPAVNLPLPGKDYAAFASEAKMTPDGRKAMAKLHEKYDPFLAQRGITGADAERWMNLMFAKEQTRLDFQAAVDAQGVTVGPELQGMRGAATRPYWDEMFAILGDGGAQAFNDYERSYYYRTYYVADLQRSLANAGLPLSDAQAEAMSGVLRANTVVTHPDPTQFGDRAQINWNAALAQAEPLLTPQQLALLQARAQSGQLPH